MPDCLTSSGEPEISRGGDLEVSNPTALAEAGSVEPSEIEMSLRTAIAKWLDPEAADRAERYLYLRSRLSEAERWLGYEWPEVDATIRWAKVSEVLHFRPLDAPTPLPECVPGKPWVHSIPDFREHLRKLRADHLAADAGRAALAEAWG